MKAAVVQVLGQAPKYQEFAEPVPNQDEVLINVHAAGLHPIVKALASGAHYSSTGQVPMVAGIDGVGTRPDGARVYFGSARKPWGTMAERCAAPSSMCLPLPDGISDVEAAAIANPGMSAWLSLKQRAELKAGETVLILGATGVAGRLAIQASRYLGAKRVIAVGRNVDAIAKENVDAIIALGQSDDAVREAFVAEATSGIDVVIDYLWGRPTELLLEALAKTFKPSSTKTTRLVEVGESAGKTITLPGSVLRSVDLKLLGSGFGSVALDSILAAIPSLFAMAADGTLSVDVECVPLAEVETAWTRVEKGRRIVFEI
ncbi:MAG: zinc-binding alcohol dehydrogenase family protein [Terracidiphilus sp.]